ncbi:hypothetical protein SAMN03159417_02757 [Ralstonia sp. NFACC01]|nr:hypothetical protein SAMN03159417_02757 [Ralstonia sp. NFACC01]
MWQERRTLGPHERRPGGYTLTLNWGRAPQLQPALDQWPAAAMLFPISAAATFGAGALLAAILG